MVKKAITEYLPDELEAVDALGEEQEITLSAYRGDDRIEIWVSDNLYLTKMKNAMKRSKDFRLEEIAWTREGRPAGYRFSMPKKWLKFNPPRQVTMTDEQRAAAVEKGKMLRAAQMAKKAEAAAQNQEK